jgi:hypothetical protein
VSVGCYRRAPTLLCCLLFVSANAFPSMQQIRSSLSLCASDLHSLVEHTPAAPTRASRATCSSGRQWSTAVWLCTQELALDRACATLQSFLANAIWRPRHTCGPGPFRPAALLNDKDGARLAPGLDAHVVCVAKVLLAGPIPHGVWVPVQTLAAGRGAGKRVALSRQGQAANNVNRHMA